MHIVYECEPLVVTKSLIQQTYIFHLNRLPVAEASKEAVIELAKAILREEKESEE